MVDVKCFLRFLQGLLKKNEGSHSGPLSLREAAVTDARAQTTRPAHRRCLKIPNDETFVFFLTTLPKIKKPLASTPTAILHRCHRRRGVQSSPKKATPFGPFLFLTDIKKEVPFPETLTRSVTRLPGRNFFYFILFIQVSKDLL